MGSLTTSAVPAPTTSAAGQANPLMTVLVTTYVFLLLSRISEFAAMVGAGKLFLMMITSSLGVIAVVFAGRLLATISSLAGKCLAGFTVWLLVATALSSWHMGSLAMLKERWLRAILAFIIVAGLTTTLRQLRIVLQAAGYAVVLAAGLTYLLGGVQGGRFAFEYGTLGNANELALVILIGLPLIVYCLLESKPFLKLVLLAPLGIALLVLFRTGSRGGLLTLIVLMLMVFFRVSMINKVKLAAAAVVALGLFLALVPRGAMERYRTLVPDATDRSAAFDSARQSAEARLIHLQESLALTLRHPLFGVGPGIFSAASAAYEKSLGRKEMWRETHNAYTQVSSECGIPALILFLAVLGASWRSMFRVGKMARERGDVRLANLVFCVKLSFIAFLVDGFFDSIAYSYYFPLLAAFAVVLEATATSQSGEPLTTRASTQTAISPQPVVSPPRLDPVRGPAGLRPAFGGYRRSRPAR